VVGSVAELSERTGEDLSSLDLHRPFVDKPSWDCPTCAGGSMQRVPDVADCWFDSGAMPIAQWHYPFENQELFEVAGQADFISEAIDQTRGWFYTLHALSTLLFDRPAYKNVICLGHLLDGKGEKMSKSKGNIVNPWEIIGQFGADATRWYMFASAPPYNSRRFSAELVSESLRQFMLTLWNTYAFFVTYANLDGWTPEAGGELALQPIDRWALARLNGLVRDMTADLERYDMHAPAKRAEQFVDELSNWYVRRNRRRFWKSESDGDKRAAYHTLYTCLTTLTRLIAPFTPFMAEEMYRNLEAGYPLGDSAGAPESVHMAAWPTADESLLDDRLIRETDLLMRVVSLGHAARKTARLKVRQPLSEALVRLPRGESLQQFADDLRDELNIKAVRWLGVGDGVVEYRFKPNLRSVGKKYGKLVPAMREALAELGPEAAATIAHQVEAGEPFELVLDGNTLTLTADDVLMEATSPEGYAVAEGEGVLVALVTALTDELRREGLAREIVRNLNDARKAADLGITDRISATVRDDAGLGLAAVLAEHAEYIKAETLCDQLELGAPADGAHVSAVAFEKDAPAAMTLGIVRQ
jgi:isoleucyl-tRNA synthetase